MVTANVDIAALKARHPLGDMVEASGVRLRGRGRVRQGVCPFHDEAEGSFTVYGDSERFYCFGCGAGGDVLDFIRRVENLSLPEAIARLDGWRPRASAQDDLCQCTTGSARPRIPIEPAPYLIRGESAPVIRYRNTPHRQKETDMVNRNGSNNGHSNGTNGLVPVNGHKPDAALDATHHELLWDGLPPAVTNALGQPLDPALVSQRKGRAGRTYDYLEGDAVIDQANRIFGFGGWGYEPAGDVTLRQIENVDAKTGEVKTTSFYSAPVRVTVPGAPPRTDIGFNAVAEDNADGHETAIKGAVTDGMKRALRSFGVQFGNGFYGDQPVEEANGRRTAARQTGRASGGNTRPQRAPAPAKAASGPDNAPALRKRLVEIAVEQGFDEDGVRTAVKNKTGKDLDALDASELAPLWEAAAKKLQETQQAKAA